MPAGEQRGSLPLNRIRLVLTSAGMGSVVLASAVLGPALSAGSGSLAAQSPSHQASVRPDQGRTAEPAPDLVGPRSLSEAAAVLQRGTLRVWAPRTFVRGVNNVDYDNHWENFLARFKKEFPNFDLRFEIMEREQFEQALHSTPDEHFPDVTLVENLRDYEPLRAADSIVTMWGWPRFDMGQWVMFRQAPNAVAARAFFFWVAHPYDYKPSWPIATNSIDPADVAVVRALSQQVVRDWVSGDSEALWSAFDPLAARFRNFSILGLPKQPPEAPVPLFSVEPLLTFGNSRLALVLLSAAGGGDTRWGIIHSGVILRNTGDGWRVLCLLPEDSLFRLEEVFRSFDRLGFDNRVPESLGDVTLIGPPDDAELPVEPRPQMEWAKLDARVATYVFEIQGSVPASDKWGRSSIILISPASNEATMHWEWSYAPGRWRVWAISQAGVVSISEWRRINIRP